MGFAERSIMSNWVKIEGGGARVRVEKIIKTNRVN